MTRHIFQIGYSNSGSDFLQSPFSANGYNSVHWGGGRVAEDIFYSKASGKKPLGSWSNKETVFTDMESVHNFSQPALEAFKEYRYLSECFPDSLFILTTRNVDDWIINRFLHHGGRYAAAHANHKKTSLPELANIWEAEWYDHVENCRSYFEGKDNFLEVDTDTCSMEDYQGAIANWFDVPNPTPQPRLENGAEKAKRLRRLGRILAGDNGPIVFPEQVIEETSEILANHCAPAVVKLSDHGYKSCSAVFAIFNPESGISRKKNGAILPIRKFDDRFYVAETRKDKFYRISGVVNEIGSIRKSGLYAMDLQDGRLIGSDEGQPVGAPVISYCRRPNAENVFLWPLPEYHAIGYDHFVGCQEVDTLPFSDKDDLAVWRGALSGHCIGGTCEGVRESIPVHQVVARITNIDPEDPGEDLEECLTLLRTNVRFAFVEKMMGSDDFDVALTPNDDVIRAFSSLGLGRAFEDRRPLSFFYQHKYVICLRGYDTGSNFISAANSMGVVLKEEDGWELFYSCLFKPWVHYIPLAAGGDDAEEKLAWARSNHDACLNISANARQACALLRSYEIRERYMSKLLDMYDKSIEASLPQSACDPMG